MAEAFGSPVPVGWVSRRSRRNPPECAGLGVGYAADPPYKRLRWCDLWVMHSGGPWERVQRKGFRGKKAIPPSFLRMALGREGVVGRPLAPLGPGAGPLFG